MFGAPELFFITYSPIQIVVIAPKVISKGKEKDGGEGNSDKPRAHWTMSNEKLFLELALEENVKGNQPGRAYDAVERKDSVRAFEEMTCL